MILREGGQTTLLDAFQIQDTTAMFIFTHGALSLLYHPRKYDLENARACNGTCGIT